MFKIYSCNYFEHKLRTRFIILMGEVYCLHNYSTSNTDVSLRNNKCCFFNVRIVLYQEINVYDQFVFCMDNHLEYYSNPL